METLKSQPYRGKAADCRGPVAKCMHQHANVSLSTECFRSHACLAAVIISSRLCIVHVVQCLFPFAHRLADIRLTSFASTFVAPYGSMRRQAPRRGRSSIVARPSLLALPAVPLFLLLCYTWAAHGVIRPHTASKLKTMEGSPCVAWRRTHSCSPFGCAA